MTRSGKLAQIIKTNSDNVQAKSTDISYELINDRVKSPSFEAKINPPNLTASSRVFLRLLSVFDRDLIKSTPIKLQCRTNVFFNFLDSASHPGT